VIKVEGVAGEIAMVEFVPSGPRLTDYRSWKQHGPIRKIVTIDRPGCQGDFDL
jgi:hypothetical protein